MGMDLNNCDSEAGLAILILISFLSSIGGERRRQKPSALVGSGLSINQSLNGLTHWRQFVMDLIHDDILRSGSQMPGLFLLTSCLYEGAIGL